MQLDPFLRIALESSDIGASLLLEADDTPAVIVKIPLLTPFRGRSVGHGHMELLTYDPEGPLARFVFEILDFPTTPLRLDAFLNPSNDNDRRFLEHYAKAATVHMHAFGDDANLSYLGSKILTVQDQHRAGAQTLLDMTVGQHTMWPAAKERYMREHPRL